MDKFGGAPWFTVFEALAALTTDHSLDTNVWSVGGYAAACKVGLKYTPPLNAYPVRHSKVYCPQLDDGIIDNINAQLATDTEVSLTSGPREVDIIEPDSGFPGIYTYALHF